MIMFFHLNIVNFNEPQFLLYSLFMLTFINFHDTVQEQSAINMAPILLKRHVTSTFLYSFQIRYGIKKVEHKDGSMTWLGCSKVSILTRYFHIPL